MAQRVGIKDAAAADVSVTTVSHILSEVEGKRVKPCGPSPDWCTTICIDVSLVSSQIRCAIRISALGFPSYRGGQY
jgi:hypothetical protein